jgi:hypothetical protein
MRATKTTKVSSAGRDRRAKARRRKRRDNRVGAVRAVAKPKTREEQIKWAENLGFEALCSVTGGAASSGVRGAAATHGGAVQTAGCCGWSKYIKGGSCGGGIGGPLGPAKLA